MRAVVPKGSARRRFVLEGRARVMHFAPTPSEERLWRALRGRQLGVQFRRQVPVGRNIVDFLAAEARLIVEVDGGYHEARRAADGRRNETLRRAGYRVVRLEAEVVHGGLAGAVERIRAELLVRGDGERA
jgi:very-short-patch-repair endonuclease